LLENVTVIDNSSGNDQILISAGLTAGDLVKIYFLDGEGGHFSTRNAGSSSLNINDLLFGNNQHFAITVTSAGKAESLRLLVDA
jgi:hypothetical protein